MAKRPRRVKKHGFRTWSVWKKLGVIVGGTLAAVAATGVVLVASKMTKIETVELDTDKLSIAETEEEVETGYLNVALFGLDSREGTLGKGNRSDTIMIASLNKETKEIRLVSVFRDTLVELDDGSYNKANAAYSFGGPEGAISMLNRNLDMNIQKYVAVNFNALVDVIDAVGGLDLHLTAEEVVHMNNYCVETSKVTGAEYTKIEPEVEGDYHLNGVQSVSYARIRYTAGGDFKRAERQRLVLDLIAEKAKSMSISTVNKIIDSVFPQVSTNFTLSEMVTYAKDFKKYKLGEQLGFPEENRFAMIDVVGSIVVSVTLSSNVLDVHKFLFGEDGYTVSSSVESISDSITTKAEEPYTGSSGGTEDDSYYYGNGGSYGTGQSSGYETNDGYGGYGGYGGSSTGSGSDSSGGYGGTGTGQTDSSGSSGSGDTGYGTGTGSGTGYGDTTGDSGGYDDY